MSTKYVLRCPSPDCRKKFSWEGEFPRFCPVCGFDTATPDERTEVIAAPMIATARTKSIDDHARTIMDASEARAEEAASILGVPVSEVSDLKITDMKDNLKYGEIAVREVSNPVTQTMDAINHLRPGTVGFSGNGVGHSDAVQTGPFPNAGARTRNRVRAVHAQTTMGTMPKGQATMSDVPALETQQPGYRHRA